jgi:uncharacterized protein involved in propanediol utilization
MGAVVSSVWAGSSQSAVATLAVPADAATRSGRGRGIGHHGEVLQGVFHDSGRWCRGLVSLPCPLHQATATFRRDGEVGGPIVVTPGWKALACHAATLTAGYVCERRPTGREGGELRLETTVPVGCGFGSSTCDVLASIRATASAYDTHLSPVEIGALAVKAELASDGTMFGDETVLFAHRDGRVIESLGGPLPDVTVLGFISTTPRRIVRTLDLRPISYVYEDRLKFEEMREMLRAAVSGGDASLLGLVSTMSARINQSYRPLESFSELMIIVDECGGDGLQISHSGCIAGVVFDSHDSELDSKIAACRQSLSLAGHDEVWLFDARYEEQ